MAGIGMREDWVRVGDGVRELVVEAGSRSTTQITRPASSICTLILILQALPASVCAGLVYND